MPYYLKYGALYEFQALIKLIISHRQSLAYGYFMLPEKTVV